MSTTHNPLPEIPPVPRRKRDLVSVPLAARALAFTLLTHDRERLLAVALDPKNRQHVGPYLPVHLSTCPSSRGAGRCECMPVTIQFGAVA